MRFIDFILKNVWRRKVRTALTAFGVAVAIAAVVSLLGITGNFAKVSKEVYASRGVDLVVCRARVTDRTTSTLEESLGDELAKLPHVAKVAAALAARNVPYDGGAIHSPASGWPAESFAFDALTLVSGRLLKTADTTQVMLGKVLAEDLQKKPGDPVEIDGSPFTVVGIFESGNIMENRAAVMPLKELQTLMGREGLVSEFQISVQKDVPNAKAAMAALKTKIESLTDAEGQNMGLAAQTTEEYVSSDIQIQLARGMAWLTSAIALVVGSIGMLNTMIVSVLERTQEIGILRAIGWRKSRIMRMILAEAFALSLLGALLGTAAAFLLVRVLGQFPAAQAMGGGTITPQVVAIGLAMSILVGLVGGTYPAMRGASLPPTEALRYE